MKALPSDTALVIIDMQKAIDHPSWGHRNNPQAEENVARLLAAWRAATRPIFHVRHMSQDPASTYRPGQEGNEFKPQALPLSGERIIEKTTNSAFIRTSLESDLRSAGITTVVLVGVITNNSIEATARMAGNLGFVTYVVSDATATFDKPDYNGVHRTAEEVHAMSLANLHDEYAHVVSTNNILSIFY
jgi:nicotinamidase-related amidase